MDVKGGAYDGSHDHVVQGLACAVGQDDVAVVRVPMTESMTMSPRPVGSAAIFSRALGIGNASCHQRQQVTAAPDRRHACAHCGQAGIPVLQARRARSASWYKRNVSNT